MADSAVIGANFSNYQGTPALGGLDIGVIDINTKPIEDLARYTMIANKAAADQRQKEAESRAKQLADMTAYDLTTAIPKDREIIQKEYNDLYEYARNNPTVLDYRNNPQGWMEYNKKKNALENTLRSAKTRSILYTARQNEASKTTDPRLKTLLEKNLEEEVKRTDINTPIRITEQFDMTVPEVPVPGVKKLDVTVMGDNENIKREYEIPDIGGARAKVAQLALGINAGVLDKTTPEYINASPEQKLKMEQQFETQRAGGKLATVDQVARFNETLGQYKGEDGQIDMEALAAKNPIMAGMITNFENVNRYLADITSKIDAGVFTDELGNKVQFGQQGLNRYDYQPINYADGLSVEELLLVQSLAKSPSVGFKTTVQETDDALQAAQLKQKTQNDAENRAIERARLAQTKREWETGMNATETLRNSAWKFGEDIIGQLGKVSQAGGFIYPGNFDKLNNEVLTALGAEREEVRDESGKIIQKAGFYPLELKPGNVIRVVGNDVFVYNTPNDFRANPIASTNVANIATNRLIRELKASSGKEINLFTGVDSEKAPTTSTDTKTRTSSGSSSTNKSVGGYTNITETNVGTIGVKDGKWYNIKTGKPL